LAEGRGAVLNPVSGDYGMRRDLSAMRPRSAMFQPTGTPVETIDTHRGDAWTRSGLEALAGLSTLLSSRS
jgi:hypothetical protein